LRPDNSPCEQIDLALQSLSNKYVQKLDKQLNTKEKLKRCILHDFPFLDSNRSAELLSGGQKIILSWFLLNFTGIGEIPVSVIQHLDTVNRDKILNFWSRYIIKKENYE
jgi:hypothetical protein